MNPWVALVGRGKAGLREAAWSVARQLQERDCTVVGGLHEPVMRDDQLKGFDVVDIATGERIPMARVSRDPDLCDYAFLAESFSRVAQWSAADSDVVFFEVGKLEAAKKGHWPAIAAALDGAARVVVLNIRPSVLASVALELDAPAADLELPAEPEAVERLVDQIQGLCARA